MKILVTGANGYLGFPLTQVLMVRRHQVIGLDTNFYRSGWLYNGFLELPPIIKKDIRSLTEADVMGFDAVVHLAELSNDPLGQIDPQVTTDINHLGTMHLAKLSKAIGVARFVYYSSCSVYGASDVVADETSPVDPLTTYTKCKVLNEVALMNLADARFTPVILRNATAFGPSPRMRFDLAINNLVGLALTTGEIKMDSDGMPWRPFVHVLDIAKATACALVAPREVVHQEIFNVGDRESNYQIRDIAKFIVEALPNCRITFNPSGADKRNYRVNFEKINTRLPGFQATRDVKSGIRELIDLFQKLHLTKEQFLAKDFTRLKQISYLRSTGKIDRQLYWRKPTI